METGKTLGQFQDHEETISQTHPKIAEIKQMNDLQERNKSNYLKKQSGAWNAKSKFIFFLILMLLLTIVVYLNKINEKLSDLEDGSLIEQKQHEGMQRQLQNQKLKGQMMKEHQENEAKMEQQKARQQTEIKIKRQQENIIREIIKEHQKNEAKMEQQKAKSKTQQESITREIIKKHEENEAKIEQQKARQITEQESITREIIKKHEENEAKIEQQKAKSKTQQENIIREIIKKQQENEAKMEQQKARYQAEIKKKAQQENIIREQLQRVRKQQKIMELKIQQYRKKQESAKAVKNQQLIPAPLTQERTSQKILHQVAAQFNMTYDKFNQVLDNLQDLNQIYNFSKLGTMIQAKAALQNNRKLTVFQQFGNQSVPIQELTVVFTTSSREKYLRQTLQSFFTHNTYPIKKFIIIQDGAMNQNLQRLINTYPNITWLITNLRIGQAAACDVAYSTINTKYFFHSQDDWVYMKPGFIQYCFSISNRFPDFSHVSLKDTRGIKQMISQKHSIQNQKWVKYTPKQEGRVTGYSFNPSLRKLEDYTRWPGGFSKMTHFSSFGLGLGMDEFMISQQYNMAGKYTVLSNIQFIRHIGSQKANKQYTDADFKNKRTQKVLKDVKQYLKWWDQRYMNKNQQPIPAPLTQERTSQKILHQVAAQFNMTYDKFNQVLDNLQDLNQIYNFSKLGTMIQAKAALQNNRKLTVFQQFGNQSVPIQELTVVFTTSSREKYLRQTLQSFFTHNTYPIKKFIIIQDGAMNQNLQRLINTYPNITWLITNLRIGQAAACDVAYSTINTKYFFHSQDDWVYMKPGFIQYCFSISNRFPDFSHVSLKDTRGIKQMISQKHSIQNQKWVKYTPKQEGRVTGYSFNPSLRKLEDYTRWPGGFSKMTHFSSFGLGLGMDEFMISQQYNMAGKYTVLSNIQFIRHIGSQKANKQYTDADFKNKRTQKVLKDVKQYLKWWDQRYMNKNQQPIPAPLTQERTSQKILHQVAAQFNMTYDKFNQVLDNLQDLNQIYNFSKLGTMIQAKAALQNNRKLTVFQQFGNQSVPIQELTVVFTTSSREKYLRQTLQSFFTHNTYPIKKFIIIQDGAMNQNLQRLINTYPNITWLITNLRIGQAAACDVAYSTINTKYFFHSQDDWVYMKPGFIQYCFSISNRFPDFSHVSLKDTRGIKQMISQKHSIQNQKWVKYTPKQEGRVTGYSFNPSLRKLEDYTRWPGGFSKMTHFSSFGLGLGMDEFMISQQYNMAGKYTVLSNIQFIRHIGSQKANKQYTDADFKNKRTQKVLKDVKQYLKWWDQRYMNKNQQPIPAPLTQERTSQKILHQVAAQFNMTYDKFNQVLDNLQDLNQIYNFSKLGTMIQAKAALQNNRKLTVFQQFGNQSVPIQELTVVFTTSSREKYLRQTLQSFFTHNTYPIKKFIIIQDGAMNQNLQRLINTYPNITWLITNLRIGQAAACDVAYSTINTKYFFHSQDDWVYMKPGFIQYCFSISNRFPDFSHVSLKDTRGIKQMISQKHSIQNQKWVKYTPKQEGRVTGYSFNPSLRKLEDYTRWPGGFSKMTHFSSFGLGLGMDEFMISQQYNMAGKYTVLSNIQFIRHIGSQKANKQYTDADFKNKRTQKVLKDVKQYLKWWDQRYMNK